MLLSDPRARQLMIVNSDRWHDTCKYSSNALELEGSNSASSSSSSCSRNRSSQHSRSMPLQSSPEQPRSSPEQNRSPPEKPQSSPEQSQNLQKESKGTPFGIYRKLKRNLRETLLDLRDFEGTSEGIPFEL